MALEKILVCIPNTFKTFKILELPGPPKLVKLSRVLKVLVAQGALKVLKVLVAQGALKVLKPF